MVEFLGRVYYPWWIDEVGEQFQLDIVGLPVELPALAFLVLDGEVIGGSLGEDYLVLQCL